MKRYPRPITGRQTDLQDALEADYIYYSNSVYANHCTAVAGHNPISVPDILFCCTLLLHLLQSPGIQAQNESGSCELSVHYFDAQLKRACLLSVEKLLEKERNEASPAISDSCDFVSNTL